MGNQKADLVHPDDLVPEVAPDLHDVGLEVVPDPNPRVALVHVPGHLLPEKQSLALGRVQDPDLLLVHAVVHDSRMIWSSRNGYFGIASQKVTISREVFDLVLLVDISVEVIVAIKMLTAAW